MGDTLQSNGFYKFDCGRYSHRRNHHDVCTSLKPLSATLANANVTNAERSVALVAERKVSSAFHRRMSQKLH